MNADELILQALREDITSEDITTNSVMPHYQAGEVDLICKQDGVIAGLEVFKRVFELLDANTEVIFYCKDGDTVKKGEKIGLVRPREVLYDRINRRVLQMVDDGLVEEVRSLVRYRDLAALQTVGYKEIFDWFDFQEGRVSLEGWGPTAPGDGPVTSLERAVELIQRNTRHYAKRQLSWWGRDKSIIWKEL